MTAWLGAALLRDMASNTNVETSPLTIVEIPDTTRPVVVSAALNYSTGVLVMVCNEIMELTADGTIDSTHLYLVEQSESNGGPSHAALTLYDGSGNNGVYQSRLHQGVRLGNNDQVTGDNTVLQLTLTETQRIEALVLSAMLGGDGTALRLSVAENAFRDVAHNLIVPVDVVLTEIPDTVPPRITSASLNYNDGTLRLEFSETVDVTPTTLLNLTQLRLANVTGDDDIVLGGGGTGGTTGRSVGNYPGPTPSTVSHVAEALSMTIVLTERQRVRALEISGTPGGDGGGVVLDALAGAVVDMAGNPSAPLLGVIVVETHDSVLPTITSAELFLGTGVLKVTASETIDVTPTTRVNQTGLVVDNGVAPTAVGLARWIRLVGSTVAVGDKDGVVFTVHLTEQQRVHAVALSNTQGGDGSVTWLDVDPNAVQDMAGNFIVHDDNNPMVEHADVIHPVVQFATVNYSTGVVVVSVSETVDATPLQNIDLTKMYLVNQSSSHPAMMALVGAGVLSLDGVTTTITLTELQRVSAIAMSGTVSEDLHTVLLGSHCCLTLLPLLT